MSWEVWTMKLKMSFFDWNLLKKNVSRFAPVWILLLLFEFLIGPRMLFRSLENAKQVWRYDRAVQYLTDMTEIAGPLLAIFCAILIAGLLFKYLHNTRVGYMMHAFPMTRTCLLVTNAFSGLLFWLVPSLVTTLLNLLVLNILGVHNCNGLVFTMLGKWMLQYLCFYGIAVFAMMLSGSTVIAVLSYGALNFLFMFLPILFLMVASLFFRGLDYTLEEGIGRLSPIVGMLIENNYSRPADQHPALLWIYAAVGLVLLVLAWVHYRYRHIERAGDSMAYGWARMAFRVVLTICACMGLGVLCVEITEQWDAFVPYSLLGCFLGWFGSSMMTERSVKVFRNKKVWMGFGISAAVLVIVVLGLRFDVLGWQHRIPKTEAVESVEIWTGYMDDNHIMLTSPDDVELIRGIHQEILNDNETSWREMENPFRSYYGSDTIHICYHLAGGGTLRRVYHEMPEKTQTTLENLYSRPEICTQWYADHIPEDIKGADAYVYFTFPQDEIPEVLAGIDESEFDSVFEYGKWCYAYSLDMYCMNPKALRSAILADAAAGRLRIPGSTTYTYDKQQIIYNIVIERKPDANGNIDYFPLDIPETATETLALFKRT